MTDHRRTAAACTLLAAALSHPPPPRAETAAEVAPVVVAATRHEQPEIDTPASITVVTREQIAASGARNLAEALRARGAVQVQDFYGDGSAAVIDMRGFGPTAGANTLVLVDGRPLNNASDGAPPDLRAVTVEEIERIEVVQGSAGTLFGNQAVGGVVNVVTRRPGRLDARVGLRAGNYDLREASARVADRLPGGFDYRLTALASRSDNYRRQNESAIDDLSARLGYTHDAGEVFLEHQRVDERLELPGSLFAEEVAADRRQSAPAFEGDFQRTDTRVLRLGLRQALGAAARFEGELTERRNDRDFRLSSRSGFSTTGTQDRTVRGISPRVIAFFALPSGDGQLTAGADLETTDYALQTSLGPQRVDQRIDGIYAQAVLPLSASVTLTAGARHARVENDIVNLTDTARLDDEITVGSLGLAWRPAPDWRLFARADQNFRFAKVDEHTNVLFTQPIGLDNQTGLSLEAGAEYGAGGLEAKLLIYRLALEDEISFATVSSFGFDVNVNVNLDETRREGLIAELRAPVHPALALGGSYTYTDAEITAGQFEGNRLPLVAEDQLRLFADLLPAAYRNGRGAALYAEVLHVGERVLGGDFNNAFPRLDAYTVANLTGRLRRGRLELAARVDNLLDEEYADQGALGFDAGFTTRPAYFPSPERRFWLSASVDLP